jgi:hypothetical protein
MVPHYTFFSMHDESRKLRLVGRYKSGTQATDGPDNLKQVFLIWYSLLSEKSIR